MRCVALLRGVNVGGARTLPMRALEEAFRAAGATGVATLKLPNGVAKSELAKAGLDKAFGTLATMRNWRTVLRLLEQLER